MTAFDETINTFQSDFTTPKQSWNLGQTAFAKATGSPNDRRIAWVAPDGSIAQVSNLYSGTLNDSYDIPLPPNQFAQVGKWIVQTMDADGVSTAAAVFIVHDPNNLHCDIGIGKYGPTSQISAGNNISYRVEVINHGPDDAQSVTLTDSVPANTTFVSEAQDSGPAFTCTAPSGGSGSGQISCTINTLAVGAVAVFSFTFNVNAGVADGTVITNTASISSSTNELQPSDNTASTSNTVIGAGNVCTLTCPGDISAAAIGSACSAVVTYSTPTASGGCGADPVVCSPPSGSAFPIGTTVVNCSTAGGGSCSFNVVVTGSDTTPPSVICPSNISTPEDPAGSGAANVTYLTPPATDNCTPSDDLVVSCSPPSGSSFPTGTTTVTCTATDASNNSANCTFTVTVAANDCALTCPGDVSASSSSGCSTVVSYTAPTQTGTCGTVSCEPSSGSVFPVGTTTVICAARDTSGNLLASCNFNVIVTDTGTLTCPANITAPENPPGSGFATVNYEEPASCSGPAVTCSPAPGSTFPLGTTTVTCTNASSCTFTVTVITTECIITCPANVTVNNEPNQCGAVVTYATPTPVGNCGSDPPACEPPSGSFFPTGTTTVICTSARAGAQCSFTVRVNDAAPPTITCPGDIVTTTAPNLCSAVVSFSATATDNCPGVTVDCVPPTGSTFPKGTTTVTCTATDASNNSANCQFTVTVNDAQPPTITCPANKTLEPTCPSGAVATFAATATDNCPGVTVACSPPSGTVLPVGTTTVTCTATDTSGNTTPCTFTVTVLTAQAVIQNMINAVNALTPPLTGQQSQGLRSKLEAARDAVNENKINVACNKLADFVSQLSGFINNGTLTAAQGQPLLDSAAHLRNYLGCTNLGCS